MPYVGIQQYKGPPTPILSPRRIQPDGTNLIICSMRPFAFYLITLRSSDNLQLTNKGFLELHYLKKDVTRLTKNLNDLNHTRSDVQYNNSQNCNDYDPISLIYKENTRVQA